MRWCTSLPGANYTSKVAITAISDAPQALDEYSEGRVDCVFRSSRRRSRRRFRRHTVGVLVDPVSIRLPGPWCEYEMVYFSAPYLWYGRGIAPSDADFTPGESSIDAPMGAILLDVVLLCFSLRMYCNPTDDALCCMDFRDSTFVYRASGRDSSAPPKTGLLDH